MASKNHYISQFLISGNDIVNASVTFADLGTVYTDNVTEGTSLYFSNARVANAFIANPGNTILFTNASNVVTSSLNLRFDGTNLGFGQTPRAKLDLGSSANLRLNSYTYLGRRNNNSDFIGFNALGTDGSAYITPGFAGAAYASMGIVTMNTGGVGGTLEFRTYQHGTNSSPVLYTDIPNRLSIGPSELVINEDSTAYNFRVESDGDANMLFVDASTNRIGLRMNAPLGTVHLSTEGTGRGIVIDNTYTGGGGGSSGLSAFNVKNHLLELRAAFGDNPESVGNNGMKWGIKFTGSTSSTFAADVKGAGIYAVSEEMAGAGYNRMVGLAFEVSAFDASPTERVRITNGGNVGIGTTSPGYKLDVNGTAHVSSYAYLDNLFSGYIPHTGVIGFGATVGGAQTVTKLKWGSYGRIQHTSFTNTPFISFNAELYESDFAGSGSGQSDRNYFRPDYALGNYGIISSINGGVGFNVGVWSSATSINIGDFLNHNSFAGGVVGNGNWEFKKNLAIGGASATTSGAGITFPATQNASSNANTLDDYEEGTWTPTDVSGAGLTFANVTGAFYTKVGNLVTCWFEFSYPATGNTAPAAIGGLPFASKNVSTYRWSCGAGYNNKSITDLILYGSYNSSQFNFYISNGNGATNASLSAGLFACTFSYQTN